MLQRTCLVALEVLSALPAKGRRQQPGLRSWTLSRLLGLQACATTLGSNVRFDHLNLWKSFGCKSPSSQLELLKGNSLLTSLVNSEVQRCRVLNGSLCSVSLVLLASWPPDPCA